MAYGWHLEAEYKSGFVHSNEHADVSPYAVGEDGKIAQNVFNDILEKRAETIHGRLVRLSLIGTTKRYDIDWAELPDNARPIYLREMQHDLDSATGTSTTLMTNQTFGYQYTGEDGKNYKEVSQIS
jgi:hypothetical protein